MRVQHNITAMNSYRNFTTNNSSLSKNLEKLSSGYAINRAGDNAAGLAISEKMRAQITGLDVAQKNANDGISLVQTAEGALTEVHSMLNRMYELSMQSANGTYESSVDRAQLQKEVDALKSEINRIADSANFNGINLLDGSLSSETVGGASSVEVSDNLTSTAIGARSAVYKNATALGALSDATAVGDKLKITLNYTDADGNEKTVEKTLVATSTTKYQLQEGDQLYELKGSGTALSATATMTGAEFAKHIAAALSTDEELGETFAVYGDVGTEINGSALTAAEVNFVAAEKGVTNAGITSLTVSKVAAGQDDGEATNIVNWNWATGADSTKSSFTTVQDGVDATTVYEDFSLMTAGKTKVADSVKEINDKAFEINGEKFVFVDGTTALNDNDLAAIEQTGVHVVQAAGSSLTNADVAKMVEQIKNVTGLDAVQGAKTANETEGVSGTDVYGAAITSTESTINKFTEMAKGTVLTGTTNLAIRLTSKEETEVGGKALTLQIGDTSDSFNQMEVEIADMHTTNLGIKDASGKITSSLADVDISTQDGAAAACDVLKAAINQVSDTRGGLGTIQNRLEHTINNLGVMQENLQNAESVIRDTDVASEMMEYTKNSILNQSAQAMLAQANQLPQGVLQLLQ